MENNGLAFFERKTKEFEGRQKHWAKKHKKSPVPEKIKKQIKKLLKKGEED